MNGNTDNDLFSPYPEGTTTLLWKNILYPMYLVKHGKEKFRAPSLSTGIRVEKKKKSNNNNCIPLSTGLIFTREKPPFCHLPIVSMKASKRLEKYKLWFLKDENLSALLYLFSRFFNYHVHLSYHQSVPSYLRIRRSRYLAKPTRLTKLFQMILSTKSHFDKTLIVIFKCGYCI